MTETMRHAPRILQGIVGSRAYGLDHENSDTDRAAVAVLPAGVFVGLNPPKALTHHATGDDDITVHELGKFVSLCLSCNPTAMELLWLDDYEVYTNTGEQLLRMRHALLSQRVRGSFLGYANSQLAGAARGKAEAKREKFGRHLYRLVHTGVTLWRTGEMVLRVANRDEAFAVGREAATGDLSRLQSLMMWAENEFDKTTPLPEQADVELADDFVRTTRLTL